MPYALEPFAFLLGAVCILGGVVALFLLALLYVDTTEQ